MKSKKLFVETSVFIRFLTKDNQEKYLHCKKLFEAVAEGKIRPYTSNIVIMELIFILTRHYKFSREKVIEAIRKLLLLRNLTLIEKTDTEKAIFFYKKHRIKYGDCLIASQIPHDILLATYDDDFKKISKLTSILPENFV